MIDPVDASLIFGGEAANALDLVTEEVEPQTMLAARREQINDASAHRELARFGYGIDAEIAVCLQQAGKSLAPYFTACGQSLTGLADAEGRQIFLNDGTNGGQHQLLSFGRLL